MLYGSLVAVFLVFQKYVNGNTIEDFLLAPLHIPIDARLQYCELAEKYENKCIRYNVTTKDGYILGLFNIPGNKEKPVLLQHGFLSSSDDWLIRGKGSLVSFLVDNDFDVWSGNMRGNKHSRAHVTLDPEHWKFWDFSFHEIGIYDMPAMIDFVLNSTGQTQLQAIGHSEGTTVFYVMGSMLPEYNDKVKVLISLAPIAYLRNAKPLLFSLISVVGEPIVNAADKVLAHGEFLGNSSTLVALIRIVCIQQVVKIPACIVPQQHFGSFTPVIYYHFLSGTSKKNAAHLLQTAARDKFGQYDYGLTKNKVVYDNIEPPDYNLSKCVIKHAFVIGMSDDLADAKDVQRLRNELPHVIDYHVMEQKQWNHGDFIWGKNMSSLFVYVQKILNKYY